MIFKMLKKDFLREKVIALAVFTFIMLSSILIASGTNMIIDLSNSLDNLMKDADSPHFSQAHSGEVDQELIDKWSNNNPFVKSQQTSEMIHVEGSKIYLNSDRHSEEKNIMDIVFIKQNERFDLLLNLNNEKISLRDGEIAVPIYFMQKNKLKLGDKVYIIDKNQELTFTITDFVRDVQMNPSIISSKRFIISDNDFDSLKGNLGESEYLISFQLHDIKDLPTFINQYGASNLPQKGPTIDYNQIKILNSITDGLVAAVIILISFLLNVIALLSLRFTILSTIEEDYREIGVMKAIGILPKDIKKIYIAKYFILSFGASILGFIISIFLNQQFSKNIMLYIGTAQKSWVQMIIPLFASLIVFIMVLVFCIMILKRFDKISPIDAIRIGNTSETFKITKILSLYKCKYLNANIFLGIRDVLLRFKSYILLFFVFIICTFIIIVPLNFTNTSQSSNVVTYLGIGESDIIIDLHQTSNVRERFEEIVGYMKEDSDVNQYATFVTCQYDVINKDGYEERLAIDTGDFTIFPLDYMKGITPTLSNEIALSYLTAKELDKNVGDEVILIINDKEQKMIVSGIYQSFTNGGRSAKANIEPNYEKAIYYTINMDVKGDVSKKISEYENQFKDVRVTDLDEFAKQTFENVTSQLKMLTVLSIIIAVLISVLITSLFLKLLIAKDMSQIAIMRSIGVTLKDIRIQYITKSLMVLNLGIVIGTIIANSLGEILLSQALSIVGVSKIEFEINPLHAYVLFPVMLMIVVTITTLISITSIKEFTISDINQE